MRNFLTAAAMAVAAFCAAAVLAVLPTAPAHALGKCWTMRLGPEMARVVPHYTLENLTDPRCWIKWITDDRS
ncbi:hypothetical protein [Actinocorallia populi]|uniref:hypothetical protein n=1 Tax=Actinocorallia populi TaxID=2079200 RepID=UPI000D0939E3|nr:hypothetical protein [Actinocorallia populi]